MDPVSIIKQDHRTVKGLFRQFEKAKRKTDKQRIGQEIIEELSVHATIEEQLVYPLLRESAERLEDPVLNALEEHHSMKLVLLELDKMKADHERYAAKMHVVQESVEMHIEEEESKLLPRLDQLLEREQRKALAEAMLEMKQTAPNHPHPGGPDTPPGLTVAGLISSLADTGKDIVRSITDGDKARGHRRVTRRAEAAGRKRPRARAHRVSRGRSRTVRRRIAKSRR